MSFPRPRLSPLSWEEQPSALFSIAFAAMSFWFVYHGWLAWMVLMGSNPIVALPKVGLGGGLMLGGVLLLPVVLEVRRNALRFQRLSTPTKKWWFGWAVVHQLFSGAFLAWLLGILAVLAVQAYGWQEQQERIRITKERVEALWNPARSAVLPVPLSPGTNACVLLPWALDALRPTASSPWVDPTLTSAAAATFAQIGWNKGCWTPATYFAWIEQFEPKLVPTNVMSVLYPVLLWPERWVTTLHQRFQAEQLWKERKAVSLESLCQLQLEGRSELERRASCAGVQGKTVSTEEELDVWWKTWSAEK